MLFRSSVRAARPLAPLARGLSASAVRRDHFLDVDPSAFKKRALEGGTKPVLVDFYADWCQPCRVLSPVLKKLTGPETQYDLMTVDVDKHPELAGEFKVTALPTVVAFKDGKVKNKFLGFRSEADVKKFLTML
ncbi:thioredoxin-like protein [Cutaneotrichosporon oleaginosum]|uniref:Thioredoxin-like protein n=1 Tax=Cutaneotrichosporon oleaginosum TaxID=879819 RepID=A0A0J0XJ84_9TREE|nr:thioredoxin-like protein [Cutaneotrichosporon oleaginosum]KLT41128.1 thioredoxin-like protein [Cutaneotrichosporon oleaginosum]TXT05740.1 hypothetical protein COLE_07060 [Cutaneotrichosporon oleaginosum]